MKAQIDEISLQMRSRAKSLNTHVMAIRRDSEILQLWDKLCQCHMEAMALCTSRILDNRPKVCYSVLRPLGCVEIMHLSDEETCCTRFLKRIDENF